MAWTDANPVAVGGATKKSNYDVVYDNADYLMDYIKGDNGQASGATGHDHDGTDSLKIHVSATDKILGRVTAGAGTVEEIACTAAGRALLDDANADAQLTTLGVTAAGKALLDDADAAAQRTTLGLGSLAVLSTVVQGTLTTTTGEVSHTGASDGANLTLPGGSYGFYPQLKVDQIDQTPAITGYIGLAYPGTTSYATIIYLGLTVNTDPRTAYAQQRYITASGKEHWVFLLIEKDTGNILSGYSAPEHPCYGNGDDPEIVPHPFADYWNKPLPQGQEIVVLDMESIKDIKGRAKNKKSSILETIHSEKNQIDFDSEVPWIPRDMDGVRILNLKHSSYSVRSFKG